MKVDKIFLTEPVHDGEPVLRAGLSPVDEQCPLYLGLLPVLLPSIELVESHLAGVGLYGHDVRVHLNYIQLRSVRSGQVSDYLPSSVT